MIDGEGTGTGERETQQGGDHQEVELDVAASRHQRSVHEETVRQMHFPDRRPARAPRRRACSESGRRPSAEPAGELNHGDGDGERKPGESPTQSRVRRRSIQAAPQMPNSFAHRAPRASRR